MAKSKARVALEDALQPQSATHEEWLLFSLPDAVEAKLAQLAHGEFTGEQIRRDHPELFQVVVRMGNEGLSLRIAQRMTGLSKNTVAAIYQSSCVGTAAQNAELARRARQCLTLLFDDFERRLETAQLEDTKDLAVLAGILLDKLALLQGGPTATILHRHEVRPGFEDYLSQLRQVRGSVMGLGGASAEQMGGAPGLPAVGGSGLTSASARTVIDVATDAETVVPDASNRDGAGDDTDCAADRREPGDGKVGGEGVAIGRAAGGVGGINPSRNFEQRPESGNGSVAGAQGAPGADPAGAGRTPADPP